MELFRINLILVNLRIFLGTNPDRPYATWIGHLLAANISKTIRCMPMKFSEVDGMVKLNILHTFVVIGRQKLDLKQFKNVFFQDYFLLFC